MKIKIVQALMLNIWQAYACATSNKNKKSYSFCTMNCPILFIAAKATDVQTAQFCQTLRRFDKLRTSGNIFLLTSLRLTCSHSITLLMKEPWATGRKVWQGTVTPSRRRTLGSIPRSPTTSTFTQNIIVPIACG